MPPAAIDELGQLERGPDRGPWLWSCLIDGEAASKANSRRIFIAKGRPGKQHLLVAKSAKAMAFKDVAVLAMRAKRPVSPFLGAIALECTIWYASLRPDLDESLVMDALQAAGVIGNDRQIVEKHVYRRLDHARPRVLVTLRASA